MPQPRDTAATGLTKPPSDDYSDNRQLGEWKTRYPTTAWTQIAIEGSYLVVILVLTLTATLALALRPEMVITHLVWLIGPAPVPGPIMRQLQIWGTVFFSGMTGATAFAMKWLYHSIAWRKWNRDRIIWRLSVPLLGGVLATFTGAMIISGVIPILSKELFVRIVSCAGYGFLVGLFADNFLAALERFAKRLLGTLGRSE